MSCARALRALSALGLCALVAVPRALAQESDRVEQLAETIRDRALELAPSGRGAAMVAAGASLPEGAPDPEGLSHRLAAPLVQALRGSGRTTAETELPDGVALDALARRAAMRDYALLVAIRAEVVGSFLVVHVDAFTAARGRGLLDLFDPRPEPLGGVEVRHRLDAHLRRYTGALPRVTSENIVARAIALPSRGYLAMTVLDLDGDGRNELVLAKERSVEVLRLGASRRGAPRLVVVGSADLDALPAPPSRVRRPIGTAVAEGRAAIVRTSEQALPFVVTMQNGEVAIAPAPDACPEGAFPLEDACAVTVAGRDYFTQALVGRSERAPPPEAPSGFYARAARDMPVPDGSTARVEAVVTPRGRLAVRVGDRAGGAVGYGAALGMTDLEDDGLMELLLSGPGTVAEPDRLSLVRLRSDGAVIAVWSGEPIDGAVWIAGAGDLDHDGRDELLAVEEPSPDAQVPAMLWVVR